MITKSLDSMIHKLGGAVALARAMEDEGVKISHTTIVKWYSSENVHPKRHQYREAIKRVAIKNKISVSLDL